MSWPGQRRGGSGLRLERFGRVVDCGGEAVVRFTSQCGLRDADGGCVAGCGLFRSVAALEQRADASSRPEGPRQIPLTALPGGRGLQPGDPVVLSVSRRALTGLAWLLFGVPLVALLGGAWLGSRLAGTAGLPEDPSAALVGLLSLALVAWLRVDQLAGRFRTAGHGDTGKWQAMLQLSVRRGGMDS